MILADASATFSMTSSYGVGQIARNADDKDDDNAVCLRESVKTRRLHLVNTRHGHSPRTTYITEDGINKRIDYTATSKQYLNATTEVKVLSDFDTGVFSGHHVPVVTPDALL
eukprot:5181284-Pyramimonas_sp.AAC.1